MRSRTNSFSGHREEMGIHVAAENNATLLCRLGSRTFIQAFRAMNNPKDFDAYLSRAFSLHAISAEIEDRCAEFFVAFAEDEPAGYFKLYTGPAPGCVTAQPTIEIARLYALENWWGRGVGDVMMEKILSLARHKGFATLWLSSWKKNDRGNTFYRKWGFEAVGEQTFTIGRDVQQDFIMSRSTKWIPDSQKSGTGPSLKVE